MSLTVDKAERSEDGSDNGVHLTTHTVLIWSKSTVWVWLLNWNGLRLKSFLKVFCCNCLQTCGVKSCLTISPSWCTEGHITRQMKASKYRIWWIFLVNFMKLMHSTILTKYIWEKYTYNLIWLFTSNKCVCQEKNKQRKIEKVVLSISNDGFLYTTTFNYQLGVTTFFFFSERIIMNAKRAMAITMHIIKNESTIAIGSG